MDEKRGNESCANLTHEFLIGGYRSTAMASSASRAEVLSLFRSLLRTATKFSDYNIREYAKRRAIDGFRDNRGLTDPSSIVAAFADGKSQLEVAKRQAVVYSLYAPRIKSVMEAESP